MTFTSVIHHINLCDVHFLLHICWHQVLHSSTSNRSLESFFGPKCTMLFFLIISQLIISWSFKLVLFNYPQPRNVRFLSKSTGSITLSINVLLPLRNPWKLFLNGDRAYEWTWWSQCQFLGLENWYDRVEWVILCGKHALAWISPQSDFWYKVHGLCYAVHYVCSVLVLEVTLLCLLHDDVLLIELSRVE
jgi:hypothetical protein